MVTVSGEGNEKVILKADRAYVDEDDNIRR